MTDGELRIVSDGTSLGTRIAFVDAEGNEHGVRGVTSFVWRIDATKGIADAVARFDRVPADIKVELDGLFMQDLADARAELVDTTYEEFVRPFREGKCG